MGQCLGKQEEGNISIGGIKGRKWREEERSAMNRLNFPVISLEPDHLLLPGLCSRRVHHLFPSRLIFHPPVG